MPVFPRLHNFAPSGDLDNSHQGTALQLYPRTIPNLNDRRTETLGRDCMQFQNPVLRLQSLPVLKTTTKPVCGQSLPKVVANAGCTADLQDASHCFLLLSALVLHE
eukprot:2206156-Amphidinium_carterae.1